MGQWNMDFFSNDLTLDVKDTYLGLLKKGCTNAEAYTETKRKFLDLKSTDEEPLFWISLAYTQWTVGRLSEEVRAMALQFILKEIDDNAKNTSLHEKKLWKRELHKIKKTIEGTSRAEVSVLYKNGYISNPWNIGDIYAYQFHSKIAKNNELHGKYILFQKVGNVDYYDNTVYSVVRVFDKLFDTIPTENLTTGLSILPLILSPSFSGIQIEEYVPSLPFYYNAAMIYNAKFDYPCKHFTFVCSAKVDDCEYKGNEITNFLLQRTGMEEWLVPFYLSWQSKNHKTIRNNNKNN